jgi:hypothetical protein
VDFLFRNVRDDVRAATDNAQQPFVYGSLSSEEIYLNPPRTGQPQLADSVDSAEVAWSFLKTTNDIGTLTRFTDRFPASAYVSEARARIALLESMAMSSPGVGETDNRPIFTGQAPDNAELEEAEKAIARRFTRDGPAVKAAWDVIKETRDHAVIRRFVDQFPSGQRRLIADKRLADLGQRPITTRTTNVRPVALPFAPAAEGMMPSSAENMAAMAARDPDVLECFRASGNGACERALVRYPEIPTLPASPRFVACLCKSLGQSGTGCLRFIDANWNFPIPKTVPIAESAGLLGLVGGDIGGNGSVGSNGGGGGVGGNGNGGVGGNGVKDVAIHDDKAARRDDGKTTRITKPIGGASDEAATKTGNVRTVHAGTAHVKLDTAVRAHDVKVSSPKVTSMNTHASNLAPSAVNAPRVNISSMKTPAVNVRVPTIHIPVRLPGH